MCRKAVAGELLYSAFKGRQTASGGNSAVPVIRRKAVKRRSRPTAAIVECQLWARPWVICGAL